MQNYKKLHITIKTSNMKKIVILDFDGTIADTKPVILNTFHRTFDAMHLPQHSERR